ncbi:rod-binding protein [Rickettsiales bacterium]|nr:rod-binding protein [Rickettsiales bacterium]
MLKLKLVNAAILIALTCYFAVPTKSFASPVSALSRGATALHDVYSKQLSKESAANSLENAKDDESLQAKTRDLEAVLLSSMMQPMFPKGEESGLFGGGPGNDIYRSMLITEFGKIYSQAGGIGVAKNMATQIKSLRR